MRRNILMHTQRALFKGDPMGVILMKPMSLVPLFEKRYVVTTNISESNKVKIKDMHNLKLKRRKNATKGNTGNGGGGSGSGGDVYILNGKILHAQRNKKDKIELKLRYPIRKAKPMEGEDNMSYSQLNDSLKKNNIREECQKELPSNGNGYIAANIPSSDAKKGYAQAYPRGYSRESSDHSSARHVHDEHRHNINNANSSPGYDHTICAGGTSDNLSKAQHDEKIKSCNFPISGKVSEKGNPFNLSNADHLNANKAMFQGGISSRSTDRSEKQQEVQEQGDSVGYNHQRSCFPMGKIEGNLNKRKNAGVKDSVQESVNDGSQENVKNGVQESVKGGSQENVKNGVQESVKGGSQENVKNGVQESVKGGLQENVKNGVQESVKDGAIENTDPPQREKNSKEVKKDIYEVLKEINSESNKKEIETFLNNFLMYKNRKYTSFLGNYISFYFCNVLSEDLKDLKYNYFDGVKLSVNTFFSTLKELDENQLTKMTNVYLEEYFLKIFKILKSHNLNFHFDNLEIENIKLLYVYNILGVTRNGGKRRKKENIKKFLYQYICVQNKDLALLKNTNKMKFLSDIIKNGVTTRMHMLVILSYDMSAYNTASSNYITKTKFKNVQLELIFENQLENPFFSLQSPDTIDLKSSGWYLADVNQILGGNPPYE
ncbi:conserved Plasmodium protein, unknown function [Plasmodium ovale]|uniref:Uncharacterized protein n=2 Tax=Plasmodium ovale TaxID=36330 RepID=A0A1A8W0J9_PLAOA|nr:conserved Plasmodium protein, unknown function [Plasmodium ovale curtisi]SBS96663.1 conserved Plasmodium protein, unknown function [Plasmodium ovale curtisi]SCP05575.1 conserved Plasmodium protein, unknown function [Plasmodium ovale]